MSLLFCQRFGSCNDQEKAALAHRLTLTDNLYILSILESGPERPCLLFYGKLCAGMHVTAFSDNLDV